MTDRDSGTRVETVHVALPATLASLIVIPLVAFILASCASSPRQTPAPRDTTDTMAASQQQVSGAASATVAAGDTSGATVAGAGDSFTMPDISQFTRLQSGLLYYDVVQGNGFTAVNLREVKVHYTGMLENGTIFDSSRQKGVPIEFTLGQGRVIRGWEQGIRGMKVGGRRILIIPPSLAYGDQGSGPVPANATLVFDVQLMGVR